MKRLLLILLVWLAACTGTSEPPLDLLLAVGDGDTVAFYPAGSDDAAAVGSWQIGAAVVDLLRPAGESHLWVLTAGRLLAYPLRGGSLSSPPAETQAVFSLELPEDCSNGQLVSGEARFLLSCGNGTAWTVPLNAPALSPVETAGDDPQTVYLLGPDDLVTKIQPTPSGFELSYSAAAENRSYTITTGSSLERLLAVWSEETLLIAADSGSETYLYRWNLNDSRPPQLVGDPLELSGIKTIIALNDGWLIGGDDGYACQLGDKDVIYRPTQIVEGLVTPDLFAYLAATGNLIVLDLLSQDLPEHRRSFVAEPRGLAWIAVGE